MKITIHLNPDFLIALLLLSWAALSQFRYAYAYKQNSFTPSVKSTTIMALGGVLCIISNPFNSLILANSMMVIGVGVFSTVALFIAHRLGWWYQMKAPHKYQATSMFGLRN